MKSVKLFFWHVIARYYCVVAAVAGVSMGLRCFEGSGTVAETESPSGAADPQSGENGDLKALSVRHT